MKKFEKFNDFGLKLRDFYVQNISILSSDPSFEKLKQANAESTAIRLKAKAIQDSESGYKTERTLDVLEKLATNEGGAASAFAGAGLGLGAGLNIGNKLISYDYGPINSKHLVIMSGNGDVEYINTSELFINLKTLLFIALLMPKLILFEN